MRRGHRTRVVREKNETNISSYFVSFLGNEAKVSENVKTITIFAISNIV